jgi:predicted Fe-S protein YdhL (DUF1289 family)
MLANTSPEPPVQSPCVGICQLDGAGRYCIGCLRSLQEIADWRTASNDQRRLILARIERERSRADNQ